MPMGSGSSRLRMPFGAPDVGALIGDNEVMGRLNLTLVMSHLSCADEPSHRLNRQQRDVFAHVRKNLPGIPASLANSSGIFLGRDFCHDLVRPGIALYGGN